MRIDTNKLEKIIKNFTSKKILIIGDLMLDEYIVGKTTRLSPEAPVPIVEVERVVHIPGGAANAANNIRSLGDETIVAGVVGEDENNKILIKILEKRGINTSGIIVDSGRPTTFKSRIVSQGQHVVRVDKESRESISSRIEKKLLDFTKRVIREADLVLISDYAKGVVTSSFSQTIIDLAKKAGKRVLIDPKGEDFSKYRGCFMVTPNLKELEIALKIQLRDIKALPQAMKMLLANVNSEALLVTLSEKGMALLDKQGNYLYTPATDVKVVDISGAGDTAIATFSLALTAGADFQEAMLLSTYACSIVIGKMGTATTSRNGLIKAFKTVKLKNN